MCRVKRPARIGKEKLNLQVLYKSYNSSSKFLEKMKRLLSQELHAEHINKNKVNFTLEKPIRAKKGSRGIDLLFLTSALDGSG